MHANKHLLQIYICMHAYIQYISTYMYVCVPNKAGLLRLYYNLPGK